MFLRAKHSERNYNHIIASPIIKNNYEPMKIPPKKCIWKTFPFAKATKCGIRSCGYRTIGLFLRFVLIDRVNDTGTHDND